MMKEMGTVTYSKKPSAEELGSKVMEMFEFKENYDRERNI